MTVIEEFDPASVYDTVAPRYHQATSDLWDHVSTNGVRLATLKPGDNVLDLACGPGDFALKAARRVVPDGRVIGLDISPEMLTIARERAHSDGPAVEFRHGSLDAIPFHPDSFDAVLCGFGLFFAEDVPRTLAEMWDVLRPGGRLVVVTLTERFFYPLFDVFLDEAERQTDRRLRHLMPWQSTQTEAEMLRLFDEMGAPHAQAVSDDAVLVLDGPGTWDLVETGTGIQRIAAEIGPECAKRARAAVHDYIRAHRVKAMHLGAIYTTATKPLD